MFGHKNGRIEHELKDTIIALTKMWNTLEHTRSPQGRDFQLYTNKNVEEMKINVQKEIDRLKKLVELSEKIHTILETEL